MKFKLTLRESAVPGAGSGTEDRRAAMNAPNPDRWGELLSWGMLLLLGLGAGFCNGLLGAAGGVLLVLLLPRLSLPAPLAVTVDSRALRRPFDGALSRRDLLATSMAVMLPISAVSGVIYWFGGIRPEGETLVLLLLPSAVGGLVGARLLGKLPEDVLRRLFALLLVISGVRMLF